MLGENPYTNNEEDSRLKVTGEEPYVSDYENDLEEFDKRTKRIRMTALSVLLAGILLINGHAVYKNYQENKAKEDNRPAISYNFDKTDWVPAEVTTVYKAPAGFTLKYVGGTPIAERTTTETIEPTVTTDENGKKTYTAPEGYTLKKIGGTPIAVKKTTITIAPTVTDTGKGYKIYTAPVGFTIQREDGKVVASKTITETIAPTATTDENGKTIYTAPEGFTLQNTEEKVIAVKETTERVAPIATTVYTAPEGYVLIGNRCYKILYPEEENAKRR